MKMNNKIRMNANVNKLTLACIITCKTLTEGVTMREGVQVRHWQRTQRSRHFPCVTENGRDQRKSLGRWSVSLEFGQQESRYRSVK